MPLIIFGGILLGVATPTEVSAFAVAYALLIYREMRKRDLLATLVESAALTGMILFIIGTATVLAWILTVRRLPQDLAALMVSVSAGPRRFPRPHNCHVDRHGCAARRTARADHLRPVVAARR